VVLDDLGSSAVSVDGINWSLQMVDPASYWWASASLFYHQGQFVAVTDYGMAFRSMDGIVWTYETINHKYSFVSVTWGDGKYVATGFDNSGTIAPVVASSVDGVDWIVDTTMFNRSDMPETIQWVNGMFRVLTFNIADLTSYIHTSSDAVNWVSNQSKFHLNSINVINSIGFGFTNSGIVSANNIDSLKYCTEFTGRLISTMKTDSSITAISNEGELITSKDGVSWLRHHSQSVFLSEPSVSCVFKKHLFTIPYRTRGMLYELTDSLDWQSCDFQSNASLEPLLLATDGTKIIVVGRDWDSTNVPCVAMISTDGLSWVRSYVGPLNAASMVWGNNHFIVYGDSAFQPVAKVSPDGIHWYSAGTVTQLPYGAIVWNGSMFVSVGTSANYLRQTGHILTSSDGLNWTSNPNQFRPINTVFWLNNQFIAVGKDDSIYTSNDGQNWSNEGAGSTSDLYAASWYDNKMIIVGNNGLIASSPSMSSIKFRNSYPQLRNYIRIADQRIYYSVSSPGNVSVKLFDLRGRLMQTLANRRHSAGSYNLSLPQKANGKCCLLIIHQDDHTEAIKVLPIK
jgi:hypothetical protein